MREALLRAVAHDPDKRFESIAAMLEAFGPMPTTTDELGSLAAAVRRLLMRRTGAEAQQMLRVLDSIEQVVAELDAKAAALAGQTKPEQAAALARELEDVQARREAAKSDADRDLLQQQIDSLQERLSGIDRAREVVDRLRTRRSVAENHLQQLHLDLMRAEASATDLPDLTGPLQELRYQVDAAQEVEALLR
jgi:chromosome segregation ATPase